MADVTCILCAIENGNPHAADQLLPLVYDELRQLAAQKLKREKPGQTLQPTALVHEAYLRLVDTDRASQWDGRSHFFAAAAEAMRRILIDNARRKKRRKRGGDRKRVDLESADLVTRTPPEELLVFDESLRKLAAEDAKAGQLVKLHYYAGLSIEEAGKLLGLARSTAYEHWAYAKAWLHIELYGQKPPSEHPEAP